MDKVVCFGLFKTDTPLGCFGILIVTNCIVSWRCFTVVFKMQKRQSQTHKVQKPSEFISFLKVIYNVPRLAKQKKNNQKHLSPLVICAAKVFLLGGDFSHDTEHPSPV